LIDFPVKFLRLTFPHRITSVDSGAGELTRGREMYNCFKFGDVTYSAEWCLRSAVSGSLSSLERSRMTYMNWIFNESI